MLRVVFFLCLFLFSFNLAGELKAAEKAKISGQVFEDVNINGIKDLDENYLSNLTVNLYQNDKLVNTTITSSVGFYEFANLMPGNYQTEVVLPSNWEVTTKLAFSKIEAGQNQIRDMGCFNQSIDAKIFAPIINISDISVKSLSDSSVEISWFTNSKTVGQVIFDFSGKTGQEMSLDLKNFGYAYASSFDFEAKTFHTVVINNLQADATYFYRVRVLPDPNQWRGANYLVSDEISFTTSKSDHGSTQAPIKALSKSVGDNRQLMSGRILSTDYSENDDLASIISQAKVNEKKSDSAALVYGSCKIYIIILLILNFFGTILLWASSKNSEKSWGKNLWWQQLIVYILPTILAYPECWLNIWLLGVAVVSSIYILVNSKKPDKEVNLNSPFNSNQDE